MIRLCEKHRDIAFHAFTNGTLIDDEFCKENAPRGQLLRVSIEGFEEANDGRRGDGHFQKALAAMDLMRSYRIPSAYLSLHEQKLQGRHERRISGFAHFKGCVFAWYFHYMPVGGRMRTRRCF